MSAEHSLREAIAGGDVQIGVIGLGYVGLPLALAAAGQGFRVLGFDVDGDKVDRISRGDTYIPHLDHGQLQKAVSSGRLEATADFGRLDEPDALLVCVPTPVTADREPDLSYVVHTMERIAERLRPGQLVVLESTTYPGTTDEIVRETLETSGLSCGEDFFLAYSPEREDPGNKRYTTETIPKVVGGVDSTSGDLAEALYGNIVSQVVRVSTARAAEATKLSENVFRAVNIALVNELKMIYDSMDVDIWEVLDAAETKPFGYMRFDPGPGWGGHCIPVDPFYLAWKARQYGRQTRFIELAGEINAAMPRYVVERLIEMLDRDGRRLARSRVLVLGLAFKPDVADDRESPSYRLMDLLDHHGAEVEYFDPHIPVIRATREHARWEGLESVAWDEETIASFDAVVISTAHRDVDYERLADWAQRIVDTRNVMAPWSGSSDKIWKA